MRNESEAPQGVWCQPGHTGAASAGPSGGDPKGIEQEHICWDPKDGELYLNRMNPEETLVEVRRDSDVQIVR